MFVKTLRAKTLRTEPPTPRAPATKKPRIVYDIGYSWDFTSGGQTRLEFVGDNENAVCWMNGTRRCREAEHRALVGRAQTALFNSCRIHDLRPTTYYLLLTTYYLLLTTYYILRTTYCLLLTAYVLLLAAEQRAHNQSGHQYCVVWKKPLCCLYLLYAGPLCQAFMPGFMPGFMPALC